MSNYPKELTALPKKTAHIPFVDMGHLFSAHVPVVDLPQSIIDTMPPEERSKAYDVHLMFSAVTLCLN